MSRLSESLALASSLALSACSADLEASKQPQDMAAQYICNLQGEINKDLGQALFETHLDPPLQGNHNIPQVHIKKNDPWVALTFGVQSGNHGQFNWSLFKPLDLNTSEMDVSWDGTEITQDGGVHQVAAPNGNYFLYVEGFDNKCGQTDEYPIKLTR